MFIVFYTVKIVYNFLHIRLSLWHTNPFCVCVCVCVCVHAHVKYVYI